MQSNFRKGMAELLMAELLMIVVGMAFMITIVFNIFLDQTKQKEKITNEVKETIVNEYNNKDSFFIEESSKVNVEKLEKERNEATNMLNNFFIGVIIVIGLFFFINILFKAIAFYIVVKEKKDEILKFNSDKYFDHNTLHDVFSLKNLNDIDKNLIIDLYKIVHNENTIEFIKDQLKVLYKNSYDILKSLDDLVYVVDKFKRNNIENKSNEEKELLLENENKIKSLKDKFNKNLSTYNYILLQLPKLNNESKINDISNDIKSLVLNIADLKNNQTTDSLLKKYAL